MYAFWFLFSDYFFFIDITYDLAIRERIKMFNQWNEMSVQVYAFKWNSYWHMFHIQFYLVQFSIKMQKRAKNFTVI